MLFSLFVAHSDILLLFLLALISRLSLDFSHFCCLLFFWWITVVYEHHRARAPCTCVNTLEPHNVNNQEERVYEQRSIERLSSSLIMT
jgi:hypothetical protein